MASNKEVQSRLPRNRRRERRPNGNQADLAAGRDEQIETLEMSLERNQQIIDERIEEINHLVKRYNALQKDIYSQYTINDELQDEKQELQQEKVKLMGCIRSNKTEIQKLNQQTVSLEELVANLNTMLDDIRKKLADEQKKNERLLNSSNGTVNGQDDVLDAGPEADGVTEDQRHNESIGSESSRLENSFFDGRNQSQSTDVGEGCSFQYSPRRQRNHPSLYEDITEYESLRQRVQQLERDLIVEKARVVDLEQQLADIYTQQSQEHQSQQRINTPEPMTSVLDEFACLDEVRQGQMCPRCLQVYRDRVPVDEAIASSSEDEDRASMELIQQDPPRVERPSATARMISRVFGYVLDKMPLLEMLLSDDLSVVSL